MVTNTKFLQMRLKLLQEYFGSPLTTFPPDHYLEKAVEFEKYGKEIIRGIDHGMEADYAFELSQKYLQVAEVLEALKANEVSVVEAA